MVRTGRAPLTSKADRTVKWVAFIAALLSLPSAARDPHRPAYHLLPPANWTNDAMGIYWQSVVRRDPWWCTRVFLRLCTRALRESVSQLATTGPGRGSAIRPTL